MHNTLAGPMPHTAQWRGRAQVPAADLAGCALEVSGVHAGYGSSKVLFGVDLAMRPGQCVTLMGRNGMGKTTLVRTLVGIHRPSQGTVRVFGNETTRLAPHSIARLGIGLVPEGRRVFGNLNVRENLVATARSGVGGGWDLERVYAMFARLKERENSLASTLSGGEQQMLAIGRALMTNPRLLVLDEATEGLAPLIRAEIWRALRQLKESGIALLIIDKCIGPLLGLGDRHYVIEKGQIVWTGSSQEFRAKPELAHEYLGV